MDLVGLVPGPDRACFQRGSIVARREAAACDEAGAIEFHRRLGEEIHELIGVTGNEYVARRQSEAAAP